MATSGILVMTQSQSNQKYFLARKAGVEHIKDQSSQLRTCTLMRLFLGARLDTKWTTYSWMVVTFGDRPASCILEICKDIAADAGQDIDPEAARVIQEDTYVDNGATRGSEETIRRMI